jgi:hypothetical protein
MKELRSEADGAAKNAPPPPPDPKVYGYHETSYHCEKN